MSQELILSGWAMWAIGLGLLATLDLDSPLAQQVGYSVLTGIGVGQTFQPSLVAVQGALDRKDMAIVTAMRRYDYCTPATVSMLIAPLLLVSSVT